MICHRKKCILRNHSQKAVAKRFFVIIKQENYKGEIHDIRRNSKKRLGMASNRSL